MADVDVLLTDDLDLPEDPGHVTGPRATYQACRIALATHRGEYPLDEDVGFPYATLAQARGVDADEVAAWVVATVSAVEEVEAVLVESSTFDPVTGVADVFGTIQAEGEDLPFASRVPVPVPAGNVSPYSGLYFGPPGGVNSIT